MDIFNVGIITLFVVTAVFFIVLFSFIYYWHVKKLSFVVLPIIFVFEFFAMGFFVVCIVSIILNYLPEVIKFAGI